MVSAPHGLRLMPAVLPRTLGRIRRFDLMLIFTGGIQYDKGVSWMSRLKVAVSDDGQTVMTRSQRPWGSALWNDTVTKPHDVGCDHATLDDAGNVWCVCRTARAHIQCTPRRSSVLTSY